MSEQEIGRHLRNRIVAIRTAALKPSRDFDLQWQLGQYIAELERVFGLESHDLTVELSRRAKKDPANG